MTERIKISEEVKLEEAKKEYLEKIVELGKEMADYHHKIDPFYYKNGKEREESFRKWILKIYKKKNFKIIVAKIRGKIIGYGIGGIVKEKGYAKPKKAGKLINLFVQEKYRRKGIGKKIFEEILNWFKSKKIKNLQVTVDSRNKIAILAYKKYGFFEYQKRMRLDLK